MLAPWKADSVEEAVELAVKVYQRLEQVISRYLGGKKPFLGGSYGWAAPSDDPDVVLQLMAQAVEECGCADKMAYCLVAPPAKCTTDTRTPISTAPAGLSRGADRPRRRADSEVSHLVH